MPEQSFGRFRHGERATSRPIVMGQGVVRRTLGWGDRMLLAEITVLKGSVIAAHSHPHEQIGYVASGKLEFTIDGEKVIVPAGDGYTIAGGVTHAVVALEDSVAIDIFSPVREEFK